MNRATLDLGTNTALLLVVEWDEKLGQLGKVIEDRSTVVRLGQGVDQNRCFVPEAMERTLRCLRDYSKTVIRHGIDPAHVRAVATSQGRDATNAKEFFEKVRCETGIWFVTLSGEEEARASFRGALLPGQKPDCTAVIDIGGGSTEFIAIAGEFSVDVGSVRFTERYLKSNPVTDAEFWKCQSEMDQIFQTQISTDWRNSLPPGIELVGVAGTVVTLAGWFLGLGEFEPVRLDGAVLARGDLHRMVEELKWRTVDERKSLLQIDPGRADVILAGALILWRAMEILDFPICRVSTRGLRFGLLK